MPVVRYTSRRPVATKCSTLVELIESAMRNQLQIHIRVPFEVKQEGSCYYSRCSILDVHSQGPTHQEALSNLVEALQLFAESCFLRGTLERVLQDCGFAPDHGGVEEDSSDYVDVPLSLIARKHAEAFAR